MWNITLRTGRMSWRGGAICAISIAVMPRDHTSARMSYVPFCTTSGAIQCGVPVTELRFDAVELSCAATPKSASLTFPSPSEESSRFAHLTSRWMMPFRIEWRWSSPCSASRQAIATAPSLNGARAARITSRSEPRSQYSITSHSSRGLANAPNARTIAEEWQRCSIFSSRRSSPETSSGPHGRILTATVRLSSPAAVARYTMPYDPLPSSSCRVMSRGDSLRFAGSSPPSRGVRPGVSSEMEPIEP
mmetsp:Transcript_21336/g.53180  ORF Transcript_21336/g.53180 Transcript_21336/m.53180 type:complete len:247 (-) Transcript_21336:88-828(-)